MPPRKKTLAEAYGIAHFPPRARQLYINLTFAEGGFFLSFIIVVCFGMWPHFLACLLWLACIRIRLHMDKFYKPWAPNEKS